MAASVAALTIAFTGTATAVDRQPFFSNKDIVIIADEPQPSASSQTEEKADESAKMGKEAGTHADGAEGATTDSDSDKMDQPERSDPTTGDTSGTSESPPE